MHQLAEKPLLIRSDVLLTTVHVVRCQRAHVPACELHNPAKLDNEQYIDLHQLARVFVTETLEQLSPFAILSCSQAGASVLGQYALIHNIK